MSNKDPWYVSKRVYAAVILIVATVLTGFRVDIDAETQEVLVTNMTAIGLAGAALVSVVLDLWSKYKEKDK